MELDAFGFDLRHVADRIGCKRETGVKRLHSQVPRRYRFASILEA